MLRSLPSIYDPLGVASTVTLVGKMVFREGCDLHLPWDTVLLKERQFGGSGLVSLN